MTTMDCSSCQNYLPDLLLDPNAVPAEVPTHMAHCDDCRSEYAQIRATMALLDEWVAPEPSAFFDTRLYAKLRAEQAAGPERLWDRVTSFFRYSPERGLRPAMAGVLGLAMLLGGGAAVTRLAHHGATSPASSPTVNDLKIYDNNAQAVDQMDMLDEPGGPSDDASHS